MINILLYVALGILYICLQIVPIFYVLTALLDKEFRRDIKFEQWLLIPILILLMMIPFIGAVIGILFDEDNKWIRYISIFATYILLITMIIKILL